jgi:hypothetical protein
MTESFPHELLEDSQELSSFRGWSEDVYCDFLALQQRKLTSEEFHLKYQRQDEMNRASKLGEDISRATETLLTERAFDAIKERRDINFKLQSSDNQLFPFYRAILLD